MMSSISLLLLGFVLWTTVSLRTYVTGLTAQTAWKWAIAAIAATLTAIGLRLIPVVPAGITSAVHSIAATLLLAPLVDILGARNPGHRAWPWFVVTPMIVVLQWSTISHLFSERLETALVTPLPATIGLLLVLVMGTGNYFGTANTSACLVGATGIGLLILPVTEWCAWPGDAVCLASSVCLAITALLVEGRLKANNTETGHEQLWIDFRDIYGTVWSRRVMDRINQFAEREKWNVSMTLDGLRPRNDSQQPIESTERPEEILRWVLRRFADDEFLNRYLPIPASQQQHD